MKKQKHIILRIVNPIKGTINYSIDNQKALPMSKFVPAFVEHFLEDHPNYDYEKLKEIFNDDLIRLGHRQLGVLCKKEEFDNWHVKSKKNRYFINKGTLKSADNVEFYVNNQWAKDSFANILTLAQAYGYEYANETEATINDIYTILKNKGYDVSKELVEDFIGRLKKYVP
jgi:hypothetical protein